MIYKMCVPCLFGVEGLVSDELKRMDMTNVRAENGRVFFEGQLRDVVKANIYLSCGERVLLVVGKFNASTFDELFEGTKKCDWENFIPKKGQFPVKGYSLESKLHSIPDCQKIIKKAIATRLEKAYKTSWMEETGEKYQIQFSIMKDEVYLFIDTSGAGLHKRGYRPQGNLAPLRETLAAAIVKIARYRGKEVFCDPFCGSGTIVIEAALAARNIAPGIQRQFAFQAWPCFDKKTTLDVIAEAKSKEYHGEYQIWGGDIDPECIELARSNASRAGVAKDIKFETSDARLFTHASKEGVLVCNPPYGERLLDVRTAQKLYIDFGKQIKDLSGWNRYIISSEPEFERYFGMRADKKRKLYNGMIKCDLYMYFAERINNKKK